jgi:hypothetical protein
MLALIVGSLLAVGGVAYVLMPLLRASVAGSSTAAPTAPVLTEESTAIEALREIEFDRATGKLSDDDYAALKAQYTPRALEELRAREQTALNAELAVNGAEVAGVLTSNAATSAQSPALSAFKAVAVSSDPAEALIASVATSGLICPADGPRPESDALFCSECGRELVAPKATSAAAAR